MRSWLAELWASPRPDTRSDRLHTAATSNGWASRMTYATSKSQLTLQEQTPLSAIGPAGAPGQTRGQFEHLAKGVDLPIVRILVVTPGDFESARRALEECRPNPLGDG
jgi:hypothetical protein